MTRALSKFATSLLLPVLFLPAASTATSGGHQEIVEQRPKLLRSVRFVDDAHGWVAGSNGVFYTDDGGKSWQRLRISIGSMSKYPTADALDVGHVVWADRDEAIVTNDKGLTNLSIRPLAIKAVPIPNVLVYMEAISFFDRKHGFAAGSLGSEVFRTGDGGLTWQNIETPANDILQGLHVASASEVWVVGVEGVVLHTTNSGRSWGHKILKNANGEPAKGLRSIFFIDNLKGWICGPSGSIFRTINGGSSWLRQATSFAQDLPVSLNAVSFANESEGWVVGEDCVNYVEQEFRGVVLHTIDAGRHWDRLPVNLAECLLDVQALPDGKAWAVGQNGTVIYTTDHGRHWTSAQFGRDAQTIVLDKR